MKRYKEKENFILAESAAYNLKISEATVKRWVKNVVKREMFLLLMQGKYRTAMSHTTYGILHKAYNQRKKERVV